MTRPPGTLLVLLAVAGPLWAAPVPKQVKKAATLDGEWQKVSQEMNGKPFEVAPDDYNLWRVSGGQLALVSTRPDDYIAGLVSEELDGGLRSFEYTGVSNGWNRRGVCQLDGDTLKIAFGDNRKIRPEKITSENKGFVYTFKRVKPDR